MRGKVIFNLFFSLALILSLAGCANIIDRSSCSGGNRLKVNEPDVQGPSFSQPVMVSTPPDSSAFEKTTATIDYNQYLKKIWIVGDWKGGPYDLYSFIITGIADGSVWGNFTTGEIITPDFFYYRLEPIEWGKFSGTIGTDMAECEFSVAFGNRGNITFRFDANDRIEAQISHIEKDVYDKNKPTNANYVFRPYNLSDINFFTKLQDNSFAVDLESWGNINIVSGEIDTGNKIHPALYLTNEDDDILYDFGGYFLVGSRITDVSIKDINGDGLKDVRITFGLLDDKTGLVDSESEHIERVFCQMDNGLFYNSFLG